MCYKGQIVLNLHPHPAELIKFYLNFHPLKVVSRYPDPQLQVGGNYSYSFHLRLHNHFQILMIKPQFVPDISDLANKTT